ncbi:serine/threonine-protein kinase ATG1t isoform X1 [Amaranthus tricolor]|uniref:serine/threonine-protein kinase ATG1t isoform X1 n=1 Tax=Amaranthus tricolor TaxID=29722 RepID=UPI00258F153C|nr:serine/threonine-protein kinase ATG1t isoform X1 [Amaranthus tricolor]
MIVGDYILREKISENPLSTIWRANHRKDPDFKDVALKKIFLSMLTPKLKTCLDCELNFLSSVNHPNIIRLVKFFQAEGCIFLVFEFCNGGNLASYIRRNGRVREQIARDFMYQLGTGLRILQSHQIVHRDLKPENILLSSSDSGVLLKIADFGFSRILISGDYAEFVCGSPLYMAPEMLGFQRYDHKVDMWSIGAILFELLNGYPPFRGRTNVQLLKNIKSAVGLPFSQIVLQKIHPDCFDLCTRLLCVNPADRLSFEEFYCHKFLVRKKEGL